MNKDVDRSPGITVSLFASFKVTVQQRRWFLHIDNKRTLMKLDNEQF